jgi:DNA-binding GntR family transcriptional regulator
LSGFRSIQLDNRISKYRQIEEHIKALIRAGDLPPGTQLPSQMAMATEFGCARQTVREALKELKRNGWIDIRQGVGTFIRETPPISSPDSAMP